MRSLIASLFAVACLCGSAMADELTIEEGTLTFKAVNPNVTPIQVKVDLQDLDGNVKPHIVSLRRQASFFDFIKVSGAAYNEQQLTVKFTRVLTSPPPSGGSTTPWQHGILIWDIRNP